MAGMLGFLDYSDDAGTRFYAYPADRVVSIVEVWAKAPWPMTLQEAFTLRDQCGWTPTSDDGRYFSTPVSNGEEGGHILLDISDQSLACGVDVMITTRPTLQFRTTTSPVTQAVYNQQLKAFSEMYGNPDETLGEIRRRTGWALPNGSSVFLLPVDTFVEVSVRPPGV